MRNDPWELANLADAPAHAGDVARLRQELGRWHTELGDTQEGMGATFWQGYDAGK